MKSYIALLFLLLSAFAHSKECRPSEELLSGMGLGYLGLIDKASKAGIEVTDSNPLLLWWVGDGADEHDYDEIKNFGKYFGADTLSKKSMFAEANALLSEKKADIYVLAWIDTLIHQGKSVTVIKTSMASKTWPMSYEGAVLAANSSKPGWELGCGANILHLKP